MQHFAQLVNLDGKKQRFFFPTPYCAEFPRALSTLALVHVNFTCNFHQFCVVQTEVHPEVVKFEVRHRLKVTQYLFPVKFVACLRCLPLDAIASVRKARPLASGCVSTRKRTKKT